MPASQDKFFAQIREAFDGDDLLRISIRGHNLLNHLIIQLLLIGLPAEDHFLEIERLSFGLKVDLAIALGVIKPPSRDALYKLNESRNKFVHELDTFQFDNRQAKILFDSMPEYWKVYIKDKKYDDTPEKLLNSCFWLMCVELWGITKRTLEQKTHTKLMNEEIRKLAEELRRNDPKMGERDPIMEANVQQEVEKVLQSLFASTKKD